MIDTINSRIKYPDFKVLGSGQFKPRLVIKENTNQLTEDKDQSHWDLHDHKQFTFIWVGRRHEYLPVIEVTKKIDNQNKCYLYYLQIQVSIPKLLRKHNLIDLRDAEEMDKAMEILVKKLRIMGIEVSVMAIREAVVMKIHFGKSILLPTGITTREAVTDLSRAYIKKSMEPNYRDFKNGGEAQYYYSKTKMHIFYDKIEDMLKARGKSTDKEKKLKDEEIIAEELKKQRKQIIRVELRLIDPPTTQKFLAGQLKRNNREPIILKDIANSEFWQQCIVYLWEEMFSKPENQMAFRSTVDSEHVFDSILKTYRGRKVNAHEINKMLMYYSIYRITTEMGVNSLKGKLASLCSNKALIRLDNKVRDAFNHLEEIPIRESIRIIDAALRNPDYKLEINL